MSRIYGVASSIVVRSVALISLLVYSIIALYGSGVVEELFRLIDRSGAETWGQMVERVFIPALIVAFFLVNVKKKTLFSGFVSFASLATVCLSAVTVFGEALLNVLGLKTMDTLRVSSLIAASAIAISFSKLYPVVALSFRVIDQRTGIFRKTSGLEIGVQASESLRVIIHGDYRRVALRTDPSASFRVSDFVKTTFYTYVDVTPLSIAPGVVEVLFEGRLIHSLKLFLKNPSFKKIVFSTFFNEDFVGVYDVNVESHKQLIEAAQPIISLICSRLGLSIEDVKEIQFYTKDKVYIPSTAKLSDLLEVEELQLRMYSAEKFADFLRFMRKSDVYELWETLVKRLEALRLRIPSVIEKLGELKRDYEKIVSNWW